MTEPVLIRIWDKEFHRSDYVMEPFDRGFTLSWNHPYLNALFDSSFLHVNITVWSTPELHWKVREVHKTFTGGAEVVCEPWIGGLRSRLVPDEWWFDHFTKGADPS